MAAYSRKGLHTMLACGKHNVLFTERDPGELPRSSLPVLWL